MHRARCVTRLRAIRGKRCRMPPENDTGAYRPGGPSISIFCSLLFATGAQQVVVRRSPTATVTTLGDAGARADLHAQVVARSAAISPNQRDNRAQSRAGQRGQVDEALVSRVVPDAARPAGPRDGRQQGAMA